MPKQLQARTRLSRNVVGSSVNDPTVKTSSLYLTGKRNPRKPLTQKEWEKRKRKRKLKK